MYVFHILPALPHADGWVVLNADALLSLRALSLDRRKL
jgi:hypothetical protein